MARSIATNDIIFVTPPAAKYQVGDKVFADIAIGDKGDKIFAATVVAVENRTDVHQYVVQLDVVDRYRDYYGTSEYRAVDEGRLWPKGPCESCHQ